MPTEAASVPTVLKLAKRMQRSGIRGGHRLEQIARSLGILNVDVTHRLARNIPFKVPLSIRPYDQRYMENYERDVMKILLDVIARSDDQVAMIDCGADIGIICCRLAAASEQIRSVYAFEPNGRAFPYLQTNLAALGIDARALNCAVSDFEGRGEMRCPAHDADWEHAAYLERVEGGSIPVRTVDSLDVPGGRHVLMKIDVEGAELAVVEGAVRTLARSSRFTVLFEAHRAQVERSGIDTVRVVQRLAALRPIEAFIAEEPARKIDWSRPFFDQVGEDIYNICVSSLPAGKA